MTRKSKKVYNLHAFDASQAHMTGAHFGALSYVSERTNDNLEKKALGRAVPNGPKRR